MISTRESRILLLITVFFLTGCWQQEEKNEFEIWHAETYEPLLSKFHESLEEEAYKEGRIIAHRIISQPPSFPISLEQFRLVINTFDTPLGQLLDHSPGGRLSSSKALPVEFNRELRFVRGTILLMIESGYEIYNEPTDSPIRTQGNYDEAIRISSRLRVDLDRDRLATALYLSNKALKIAEEHPGSTITKARMMEAWQERIETYSHELCAGYPDAGSINGSLSCAQ